MEAKRLYRNPNSKMVGGVCSGIADYFNIDPTIVRLVWVATIFGAGAGVLAYIIGMIIIPEDPGNGYVQYK